MSEVLKARDPKGLWERSMTERQKFEKLLSIDHSSHGDTWPEWVKQSETCHIYQNHRSHVIKFDKLANKRFILWQVSVFQDIHSKTNDKRFSPSPIRRNCVQRSETIQYRITFYMVNYLQISNIYLLNNHRLSDTHMHTHEHTQTHVYV